MTEALLAAGEEPCVEKLVPDHLQHQPHLTITCTAYSHSGEELVASYNDESIYLFDARNSSAGPGLFLQKYEGHRNERTVKGVNFFGQRSEYVVSGSDCGNFFIWDKETAEILSMQKADEEVVNCLEPHPHLTLLATSGIDDDVKIWAPIRDAPPSLAPAKRQAARNNKARERNAVVCGSDSRVRPEVLFRAVLNNFDGFDFRSATTGEADAPTYELAGSSDEDDDDDEEDDDDDDDEDDEEDDDEDDEEEEGVEVEEEDEDEDEAGGARERSRSWREFLERRGAGGTGGRTGERELKRRDRKSVV